MSICPTVKIVATDPEQGEYLVINAADFDPAQHVLIVGETLPILGGIDLDALGRDELIERMIVIAREKLADMADDDLRTALRTYLEGPAFVEETIRAFDATPAWSDLTIAELKALAADRGVDLGDAKRKDDITAVLKAAEARGLEELAAAERGELTRRECAVDLTAMNVEFDPSLSDADLLALRDAKRAERDQAETAKAAEDATAAAAAAAAAAAGQS